MMTRLSILLYLSHLKRLFFYFFFTFIYLSILVTFVLFILFITLKTQATGNCYDLNKRLKELLLWKGSRKRSSFLPDGLVYAS